MKIKNTVLFSLLTLIFNSVALANSDPKTDFGIQFHTSKMDLGLKSNLGKEFDSRYFNGSNRNNELEASIFLRHIRPIQRSFFWGIEIRLEDTRQKFKRKGDLCCVGIPTFIHKRGLSAGIHGIVGMELGDYHFYGHSGMVGVPSQIKLHTIPPYGKDREQHKKDEILWGFSKGIGFDIAINNGWRIGLQYAHVNHQSQKLKVNDIDAFIRSKSAVHSLGIRLSSEF